MIYDEMNIQLPTKNIIYNTQILKAIYKNKYMNNEKE